MEKNAIDKMNIFAPLVGTCYTDAYVKKRVLCNKYERLNIRANLFPLKCHDDVFTKVKEF